MYVLEYILLYKPFFDISPRLIVMKFGPHRYVTSNILVIKQNSREKRENILVAIVTGAAIRFIAAEQSTTYADYNVASRGIDGNDLTCSLTDIVERDRYWQGEFDVTSTLDYVIIIPYDECLSKYVC